MQKPLMLKVVAAALALVLLGSIPAAYAPAMQTQEQAVVQNEAAAAEAAAPAPAQAPEESKPAAKPAQAADTQAAKACEVAAATADAAQKNIDYVQQAIHDGTAIKLSSLTLPYASANNPKGFATTVPLPQTTGRFFHPATRIAAELIIAEVLYQISTGNQERDFLRYMLEAMPYITDVQVSAVGAKEAAVINSIPYHDRATILQAEGASAVFQRGVNDLYLFLIPTQQENLYQFAATYALNNGTKMIAIPDIYMDTQRGILYTRSEKGLLGLVYTVDYAQYLVYAEKNSILRIFGFTELYDNLAFLINYDLDTIRIFFNLNGYDYMFQVWKGTYLGIANGCEQGLYKKPETRSVKFFDCADEEFPMALTFSHNGRKLFSREQHTWWLSGFQMGPLLDMDGFQLQGHVTIDDPAMRDALYAALQEQLPAGSTASINGNTVSYFWQ